LEKITNKACKNKVAHGIFYKKITIFETAIGLEYV